MTIPTIIIIAIKIGIIIIVKIMIRNGILDYNTE